MGAQAQVAWATVGTEHLLLFDLLPVPAYIFGDDDFRFLAVNAAAIARYGYSREEFLQLTILQIRPDADHGQFQEAMRQSADHDRYLGTWRHQTRSGQTFFVEIVAQPVIFDGRRAHYVVVNDLTERERMQEALFHSRRRLQALFDNAVDAILLTDNDGLFVDANPAAVALLGRPRDQIMTLRLWDVVPPDLLERSRNRFRDFLRDGRLNADSQLVAGDGTMREVEYRAVANVLPGLHLSIVRDVTERNASARETEQRLQELNTRLRNVSARARARREEDRTRLSRELHDQLGQALASLKIDLCWLLDHVEGRPVNPDDLVAKLTAMTGLVDDTIVRVRRISSELRPPVLDRLGLVAAIEWQIDEFQRRSGIHVRLQSRLEYLPLDIGRSTAVFRIFQEALTNVVTHAEATQVTVRMSTVSDNLVLVISDNGRGISTELVDSGQSLGLIGMRERAELLGGGVVIRPGRPHGTVVTVTLPMHDRRRSSRESW